MTFLLTACRLLNRGNLEPVWDFFLSQVRSDNEVTQTRENLILSENKKWQELQGMISNASFPATSGADKLADKLEAPSRKGKLDGRSGSAPDTVKAAATKTSINTVASKRRKNQADKEIVSGKREVARKQVDLLRRKVVDAELRLQERIDQLTQTSFLRDSSRHSAIMAG